MIAAAYIALGTFASVILAIATNRLNLSVAAMLGVIILLLTGVLSGQEASNNINPGDATIALFFGGMVVARTLVPTGVFDYLTALALRFVRGDGRRLLIAVVVLAAPICAILPNATVVILVAPVIIKVCRRYGLDFVQPVILLVFVANSAGLLTLVGDPATFIVGSAIKLSFGHYIHLLSFGGVLAILTVVVMLPFSFSGVWRARLPDIGPIALPKIERPWVMAVCLAVLVVMVGLFIFGENLEAPISSPAAAIVGAALVLLIAYLTGLDSVSNILRDVDWETLLFFVCIFVLVGALDKTGVISAIGARMGVMFGRDIMVASFLLLIGIGGLSSLIPNIPLVVALVPLVKQYAVGAGLATDQAMQAGYGHIPTAVLPLFFAMCFGATLGGNATLLGASSNIVAAGICAQAGKPISFMQFLRFGVPVTAAQLLVAGAYIWVRFL